MSQVSSDGWGIVWMHDQELAAEWATYDEEVRQNAWIAQIWLR